MKELRVHPWVTERGANPMISTEENCAILVTEITEDEYRSAIKSISSIMTVIKAIQKFKRGSHTHTSSVDLKALKNIGGQEDTEGIVVITESLSELKVVDKIPVVE